ncbi:MAG: M1 family metallopeptidase [Spirosomataceae bacterium]
MKKIFLFFLITSSIYAQKFEFTRDDTLRGTITPERAWWDLTYYHLKVKVNPDERSIEGSTTIQYKVDRPYPILQVDLQPPLEIKQITQDGQTLTYRKDGHNVYFVNLTKPQVAGKTESIIVEYSGKPRVAKRAPWDGGFSWAKDAEGNHFIATSCQGLGASAWWPCKDHMYDEVDSMLISVTIPKDLMDVSNGRLRKITENTDNTRTFDWFVSNPINNYGVNLNIGKYAHFSEKFNGEKGVLDMEFYALESNLDKAKEQFKQAPMMMKAFEHWFGPYPFYEDSYKLVETPYLGMEHQSSVTYGNGYKNGYLGRDLSSTGWGLKWDFIIIHESGHEWYANNITYKDVADMWVHESFTNYSENLYTEYYYGKEAGAAYVIGTRKNIRNDKPIIGVYNVNHSGSGDMYYKGGNMLHTIRQIVNNDEKWRNILREMNKTFYHKTVEGKQIEDFIHQKGGVTYKVFDQYLRDTRIPTLEYKIEGKKLSYHWTNTVEGFDMPLKISTDGGKKYFFINPTNEWKTLKIKGDSVKVDENFYVLSNLVK